MQLVEFEVQGFKSLYHCKLDNLQRINVFHGDNNVGKSNLLEAMQLFFGILTSFNFKEGFSPSTLSTDVSGLQRRFGLVGDVFSWGGEQDITLRGRICFSESDARRVSLENHILPISQLKISLQITRGYDRIDARLVEIANEEGSMLRKTDGDQHQLAKNLITGLLSRFGFYRIRFDRRLMLETVPPSTEARSATLAPLDPSGSNLKERLFWASVSDDPEERKAFRQVLRPLFADPPLSLGALQPVARPGAPFDLQLETAERSIPIDQLGSGVQQLALLGGMIALSRCWIVAIEEPEINLSWPTQKKLKSILSNMVANQEVAPAQLFISSHSPLFEFHENFFKVEMVEGRTQVTSVPNVEREELFDDFALPEGRGTRVRAGNAVVLPDYVLETLRVAQGDAVFFHRMGDRFQVLSSTQYEELLRPGEGPAA